jgi:hypothetical protein
MTTPTALIDLARVLPCRTIMGEQGPYLPGDENVLKPDTFHRVDLLGDDCWTLFVVSARVQSWHFWDRDTGKITPWREALAARGLVPAAEAA